MSYINTIALVLSVICLLMSLYIFIKSIYIAIRRYVMTKKIHMNSLCNYQNRPNEHSEAENVVSTVSIDGMKIPDDSFTLYMETNNVQLTLVDLKYGQNIAFIQRFPCIVGRGESVDVTIYNDSTISKRHVVFTYENGCVFVSDLQSSNGTLINGSRILSKCEVRNGFIMKIGRTEIKLLVSN